MDHLFRMLVLAQESPTVPLAPPPGGGVPPTDIGAAAEGAAQAAQSSPFEGFLFLILMLVVFYFLLIRPQQKRAKKHTALVKGLGTGDHVITTSGIFGRIVAIDDSTATVEVAKGTRIKILKNYVGGIANPETEKELAQAPPP